MEFLRENHCESSQDEAEPDLELPAPKPQFCNTCRLQDILYEGKSALSIEKLQRKTLLKVLVDGGMERDPRGCTQLREDSLEAEREQNSGSPAPGAEGTGSCRIKLSFYCHPDPGPHQRFPEGII